MRAPIGSVLAVVVASAACTAGWTGAARAVEAGVTDDPAPKGACGAAIGRLEAALNEARANGRVVASAPESVAAMLHHQPTRDSVAKAQSESRTGGRSLTRDGSEIALRRQAFGMHCND